jgi:hypothetical protein
MDLPHSIAQYQAYALPPKPAGGKALKRLEEFLLTRDMTESSAELAAQTESTEGDRRADSREGGKRAEAARAKAAHAEASGLANAAQDALEMLAAPAPVPLLGPTSIGAITGRAAGRGPISAPKPQREPIRSTPISTRSLSIRSIRT